MQETDYRDILRREFEARVRINPVYSMRAYARDLRVAPSKLSEALNHRGGFSAACARRLAERLGFGPHETEHFVALVDSEHARSQQARRLAQARVQQFRAEGETQELRLDLREIVGNWYHYALIDLTRLKEFSAEPAWIAARLGISRVEAQQALRRLLKHGLLTEDKGGQLRAAREFVTTASDVPSAALRDYHRQTLQKAAASLTLHPVETREFAVLTMAIEARHLPAAKQSLRKFRRRFCAELEQKSVRKDQVYALALQFFPLTHAVPEQKENLHDAHP